VKPIDPRKGIIISYPHSGLNWIRYCIEYISGLRTAGAPRVIKEGELAVYRTHNVNRRGGPNSNECVFYGEHGRPLHYRVVMLLRDYRESFVRLAKTRSNYTIRVEKIDRGEVFNFRNYFDNLRAYDEFEGKKLLVRYHDLVADFDHISAILDFLDLPRNVTDFDTEYHRRKSLKLFDDQHVSYTKADLTNFTWHQQSVDRESMEALDRFVAREYPGLKKKYFPQSLQADKGIQ
jgi:hypothetical protein